MKYFWSVMVLFVMLNNWVIYPDGKSYSGKTKTIEKDFSGESLFTGDVAFSVPITSIGGVTIALNYNSNIQTLVKLSNSVQQAGWVGLGWTLELGSIKADINSTRDVNDDKYYFVSSTGTSELIHQSGNNFILKEYNYWKFERQIDNNNLVGWKITTDNGTIIRFGNYDKSSGTFLFNSTLTKATRFLLGWDGIVTNALNIYYNNAHLISYQWDVSDIEDIFHNHTTINYYQELENINCQSYSTTAQFTQASYPESVVDQFGNKVQFNLANLSVDEYTVNTGGIGIDKPIQVLFQTKYLQSLSIKNESGITTQTVEFNFEISDVLGLDCTKRYLTSMLNKDINSVEHPKTIIEYFGVSEILPINPIVPEVKNATTLEFSGALKSIEYPTGSKVEYEYTAQAITNVTLDQDLPFDGTIKPIMPPYDRGFSGIDFYAIKTNDNLLKVYRWGLNGWYEDLTFPVTGEVYGYWVANDYIVYNQDVMKVVKRKGEGWTTPYNVIASAGNSPGSLAVINAQTDFFVLRHNVVVHIFGIGIYYGTEDISVVKWKDNSWSTQSIGTFKLGGLPNGGQPFKELEAVGGIDYFIVKTAVGDFDEYASRCAIVTYSGTQWNISTNIDVHNLPNEIWFGLYGGKDYFVTWQIHEINPNLNNLFIWHWPFSAGTYATILNPDASRGTYCGENFFVNIGESDIIVRNYNGNGIASTYTYEYTSLKDLFNIPIGSIENVSISILNNSIVVGWVEEENNVYKGKIVQAIFEDGEWVSGGIIDTYDNLNDMSRVRVFNNTENIFAEIYIWGIETKLVAYNKTESVWNLTELVDVDQLGGSYPISSLSGAGSNFVADIVQPGTQNDLKYVHSHTKAYNQNVDLKFQGNPYDFPVTKKTVTNGMGDPPFISTFAYTNGIFDETLNFAKYNKVTVTPPGDIGETVTYFYNDLGASQCEEFVSVTNFKELDGIPYKVKIYGQNTSDSAPLDPVSITTNTFSVFNIDAENGVYYKRLIKTENLVDGRTNTVDYEYNNTNGQISKITEPVKVTSDLYGLRDRVTEVTYAYSQFPAMQTSNMLSQVYEKKISSIGSSIANCNVFAEDEDMTEYNQFTVTYNQTVTYTATVNGGYFCVGTTQGGDNVLTKKYSNSNGSFSVTAGVIYYLTAHTYQCPPRPPCEYTVNGRVTYRLSNDPDDAILSQERTEYDVNNKYPYRTSIYDGTNWMVTNTVTGRNSLGQVIESQNIDGLFSTVKLGHNNQAAIGNIFNAKNSETCIADFEDNSEGEWDDWTIGGGIGNSAHTGSKGWHFNFGEAGALTKHFLASDINTSGKYILSGWIKSSFINPGILQWYVKWNNGSSEEYPANVLASGGGDWEYIELPIDLSAYPNIVEIFVFARNHNGSMYTSCDWDDLRFYPVDALINTTTNNPLTLQLTSQCDINNVTSFYEHDDLGRPIETRNDDGLVVSESNYFSSVDKFGLFNSAYPNSVTQKVFSNGNPVRNASFELGLTGTEPKGWILNTRCTVTTNKDAHTGSYSMKVVSNGDDAYVHNYLYSKKYLKKNTQYKISFWAKNNGGTSSVEAFLIKVDDGGTYSIFTNVAINVSSTTWQRYESTIVLDGNSEWDNLYNNSVLRLDVNTSGQIVYFDDIQIEEGNILHLPITSVAFIDGLGKSIQSQLWDGNDDIISGVDFDNAGRTWKSFIPYSSSSTGHLYDPNFASHSTGYAETQYFSDPLSRVNLIIEPGSSPFTPDKNTESTYGNSTVNGQLCYTSDIKQKPATNSTNWITTRQYKNKLGNVIKSAVMDGTTEIQSSTTLYNMNGQPIKTTDPRGLESTITYDALGKIKSGTSPDAGTTKYIYDQSGRMRFMIDAEGLNASPNNVLYWKYDIYGRVIEKGYISTLNWGDGSVLQNYANTDANWPPTPITWRKKFTYDVEGVAPYMKGRLYKVETNNNNDVETEVEETFIYNKYGVVITKNLEVKDFNNQIYSTSYEYDDAGRVTKINYPSRPTDLTLQNETLSGATPYQYEATNSLNAGPSLLISSGANVIFKTGASVVLRPGFTASNGCSFRAYTGTFTGGTEPTEVIYTYNNLGQVAGVGTTLNPNEYASYTYNASGNIQNENLNNGQRQVQISYDINGRPTQITSPLFTENLTYETGGYGGVGYYHGLIASTGFTYYSGGPSAYQTQFQYDNLGRLKIADIVNNSSLNAYDIPNISYDLNSNILSLTKGTTTKNYTYYTESNKVQNTDGSGDDYRYDANGNIEISSPRNIPNINYDPFTQMSMGMTISGSPVRTMMFRYSGDNERVLKSETYGTTNNSTLYIRGNNEYPLTEKTKVGTNINDKIYIYGPTGLIAIKTSNETYYALKDHLGSTRVLFEGTTNIAVSTYDYQPFGGLLRATINEDVRYRFTGQEFDGETGLWNFRARMYDDELGIFYAVDPSGQGFSPFGYCGNNPIMYTDPTGRLFGIDDAIIFGIFAGGIFGGVTAVANNQSFSEGFFRGAIVGGLSAGFGLAITPAIVGFGEAVGIGIGTGAFAGGIGAAMNNGDIGQGILYGGIFGGISGALGYWGGDKMSTSLAFNGGDDPIIYTSSVSDVVVVANRVPVDLVKISTYRFIINNIHDLVYMNFNRGDEPKYHIMSDGIYMKIPEKTNVIIGIVPGSISGPEGKFGQFVSKGNVKHIEKHVDDFIKLNPKANYENVVRLGKSIVKETNFLKMTGNRTVFQKVVNLGGNQVPVRVVVNSNGSIRTIHPRIR